MNIPRLMTCGLALRYSMVVRPVCRFLLDTGGDKTPSIGARHQWGPLDLNMQKLKASRGTRAIGGCTEPTPLASIPPTSVLTLTLLPL
jgi:hypothetical protein